MQPRRPSISAALRYNPSFVSPPLCRQVIPFVERIAADKSQYSQTFKKWPVWLLGNSDLKCQRQTLGWRLANTLLKSGFIAFVTVSNLKICALNRRGRLGKGFFPPHFLVLFLVPFWHGTVPTVTANGRHTTYHSYSIVYPILYPYGIISILAPMKSPRSPCSSPLCQGSRLAPRPPPRAGSGPRSGGASNAGSCITCWTFCGEDVMKVKPRGLGMWDPRYVGDMMETIRGFMENQWEKWMAFLLSGLQLGLGTLV